MKTLIQGCESAQQFDILLMLTSISSQAKKDALRAHLVDGLPAKRAYARFGVTQQHFSEALATLNQKADLAMQYAALQKTKAENNFSAIQEKLRSGYQPIGTKPINATPPCDD
ncbi:PapB/FocB family fimbrial expression transcriptional regulator [Shewanella sp. S23-S33]|uniref:PapB/FocB family fimbrial expression transcriptional regulator n=1 Tax=Shewanella TaxID=22 RepID=UPI00372D3557